MKCKKCNKKMILSEIKVLKNMCWNCQFDKREWRVDIR